MKSLLPLVALAASLFVVSGCASGPGYAEARSSIPQLGSDQGRVYFYRTTALGTAIQPAVRVDGKEVGTAKPKGFFYVDLAPGSHTVETSTEVSRRLTFTLERGQTRYVRLDVSMGFMVGHVYPKLVDNADGEKEIAECKFTGAAAATAAN